jgi:hypothetical protein
MKCACCGSTAPDPERRIPVGTQYVQKRIPGTVTVFGLCDVPALVLWNCPGAREIDQELLRYGVIVRKAFTCGTTRGTEWGKTTEDLRYRSLEADRMRLALNGWI